MLDTVHIMCYIIPCDEGRHPLMCRHLNPKLRGKLTCRPPGPNSGMLFGQQQSCDIVNLMQMYNGTILYN